MHFEENALPKELETPVPSSTSTVTTVIVWRGAILRQVTNKPSLTADLDLGHYECDEKYHCNDQPNRSGCNIPICNRLVAADVFAGNKVHAAKRCQHAAANIHGSADISGNTGGQMMERRFKCLRSLAHAQDPHRPHEPLLLQFKYWRIL